MRITIIGTGRIGTSIGLALRTRQTKGAIEIWGHDKEPTHANRARDLGALDKVHWNLLNAVDGADLVVLATPISALEEILRLIGPALRADAVVTDTAELKAPVLEWAARYLPARVHFVGGDPLLRPAPSDMPATGPDAAQAALFQGVPYCLVPSPQAAEAAIKLVGDLVTVLGARPFFIDPQEHDGVSTAVNGLPALLGAALLNVTTRAGAWRDMRRMASQSYAAMTEVGEAAAWRDTMLLTQASIVPWLDELMGELELLRAYIASGEGEALEARLSTAQSQRTAWLADWERGNWPELTPTASQEMPDTNSWFTRMFLGSLAEKRGGKREK